MPSQVRSFTLAAISGALEGMLAPMDAIVEATDAMVATVERVAVEMPAIVVVPAKPAGAIRVAAAPIVAAVSATAPAMMATVRSVFDMLIS